MTELYKTEVEASNAIWQPPGGPKCPVQVTSNIEVSTFSQVADQDRHYHLNATEVYLVLEGKMNIEVENRTFTLGRGDMIIINPGASHRVIIDEKVPPGKREKFLCRVVTANCVGEIDKYQTKL